ncbi:unnamed protein product [Acanthosepion pharaonis]|uniref:Uncharacterized protein n=1 Tax=Acanthosepion pharaonis TaxID=158019 RepID=A0A812EWN6_ACAPH|nr:unnamed protein product [Sepia pharaonis]
MDSGSYFEFGSCRCGSIYFHSVCFLQSIFSSFIPFILIQFFFTFSFGLFSLLSHSFFKFISPSFVLFSFNPSFLFICSSSSFSRSSPFLTQTFFSFIFLSSTHFLFLHYFSLHPLCPCFNLLHSNYFSLSSFILSFFFNRFYLHFILLYSSAFFLPSSIHFLLFLLLHAFSFNQFYISFILLTSVLFHVCTSVHSLIS